MLLGLLLLSLLLLSLLLLSLLLLHLLLLLLKACTCFRGRKSSGNKVARRLEKQCL